MTDKQENTQSKKTQTNEEAPLLNLGLNLVLPIVILMYGNKLLVKFAPDLVVDPTIILIVALAFPVAYFVYDLYKRKKCNAMSILGFASVLLTGGIGVLELPRNWFIIKEGGLPLVIGLMVVGSLKTKWPLVRTFLYSDKIIDTAKVDAALKARGKVRDFERLMWSSTWLIAFSFFLSSAINFYLAATIVTVEPSVDKVLFNEQVGKMTGVTYVVILVPTIVIMGVALWRLMRGIRLLTDLPMEEIFAADIQEKANENSRGS